MFCENDADDPLKKQAIEIFNQALAAQNAQDYVEAIRLYKKSIDVCPTAEAYTFLGWAYSFLGSYEEAIAECIAAISMDADFGNPYNDIGSYLAANGNFYDCVRWFEQAMRAKRYTDRARPHFNLACVYEKRRKLLEAARHYGLAVEQQPENESALQALRKVQAKLN